MSVEIWLGLVEVRQLPGDNHSVQLSGKGAFTWVTCWASNDETYFSKVREVMQTYGLFIVGTEKVMSFTQAEYQGIVDDELVELFANTTKNRDYCILGTLHNYMNDN